ncbi:ATP-binding protein [Nonomuraea sp. NPDC049504]|uniref:ATP-binding protein n=1 Tax=Nonomuraea sp. NPDC049504 TaxID=3154729 RepID=UPI003418D5AA
MDNRTQHLSDEPSQLLAPRTHGQPGGEEFPDLAPGLVMSTFRSRPVWGGMAWRQAFPGRDDQSAPARRMVGRLLEDTGRRQDAEWVTAELVANALQHSLSGHSCSGQARGFFVVEVLRGVGVARIVVYDLGGGSVPDFSRTPGSVLGLAEHGRGLTGVAELAVRFGVAGDASTGHAVWVELALPEEVNAVTTAIEVGAVVGAGAGESERDGGFEARPVACRTVTEEAGRVVARSGLSPLGCEGASGEELGGRVGGPLVSAGGPGNAPGSDREEGGWPGLFRALAGDVSGRVAGQVSAFGQEPWARQALAGLREDWPGWAFLVVRCRWIAMRGKQVVIGAAGPQELRQALLSLPAGPNATGLNVTGLLLGSGSAVPGLTEGGVSGPGLVLPMVAGFGVDGAGVSGPPRSGSACTTGGGGGGLGGGAGMGLSGTVAVVAPLPGVLAAERSGTGTWAVAAADGARRGWRPRGWSWWPWGKRRDRWCSAAYVRKQARPAGRDESGRGRGHRRVRSKPVAAVLAAAVAA